MKIVAYGTFTTYNTTLEEEAYKQIEDALRGRGWNITSLTVYKG